jgi:DNA-binding Xre family transcriptional regulator
MTSYKKLWKLLIDKDMVKRDLIEAAHISGATIAKMTRGEDINTKVLVKICNALRCTSSDILEIVPDEPLTLDGK